MRSSLLWTILLLFGAVSPAMAWNAENHSLLAERGLAEIADRLGLSTPIVITPYAQFLQKMAPLLGSEPTPIAFANFLHVNPAVDIATMGDDEAAGLRSTPLRILRVHDNDPDDGRDENVVTNPDVQYMGGKASQAFRHMEKPPLKWSDLTHTLGFPFREIGEASKRAEIYFDLARLAWKVDEPYWAWRWLACALHYVQDLGQPYHTTQDTSHGRYSLAGVMIYLGHLGRTGFVKTMVRLLSNSHHFYEGLVEYHTIMALTGRPTDARTLQFLVAMDGATATPVTNVEAYAKWLRDQSNRRAAELLEAMYTMSGPKLLSFYAYPQPGDAPASFVKSHRDLRFLEAERTYFDLTTAALRQSAEATRTLVVSFVAQRDTVVAEPLVAMLRKMLAK